MAAVAAADRDVADNSADDAGKIESIYGFTKAIRQERLEVAQDVRYGRGHTPVSSGAKVQVIPTLRLSLPSGPMKKLVTKSNMLTCKLTYANFQGRMC